MTTTGNILDQLERVSSRMEAVRQCVYAGDVVELAPLESEITSICGAIAGLPTARREAFRRPLMGLISDLDDLAIQVHAALDRLGCQIGETSQRRQAVAAYAKPRSRKGTLGGGSGGGSGSPAR